MLSVKAQIPELNPGLFDYLGIEHVSSSLWPSMGVNKQNRAKFIGNRGIIPNLQTYSKSTWKIFEVRVLAATVASASAHRMFHTSLFINSERQPRIYGLLMAGWLEAAVLHDDDRAFSPQMGRFLSELERLVTGG